MEVGEYTNMVKQNEPLAQVRSLITNKAILP
jgi:hypothetical protein